MKTKSIALALTLCIAAVCLAADIQMGTWKLNESKSKLDPGMTKNNVVVYAAEGDNVKITVEGVDTKGNPTHTEWTGKFDEKDYPVTGDPISDTRSYKIANDHTLTMIVKKNGKVVAQGIITVSADGKTRTFTVRRTDAMGKEISSVATYDKQ